MVLWDSDVTSHQHIFLWSSWDIFEGFGFCQYSYNCGSRAAGQMILVLCIGFRGKELIFDD